MEALECIRTRRSIRKFTADPVSPELIQDIVDTAAYAPSWKNTQICRYTLVQDRDIIDRIASDGVLGFANNTTTIHGASALMVMSYVQGRSGFERDGSYSTSKEGRWQEFDAGIAAQTFCLTAWEHGLGSVIIGIFDEDFVASQIGLPEKETVAVLIALGYPDQHPAPPVRKTSKDLLRII